MKCDKCGGHMTHMDVHKNDGVTKENYAETWKPETYVCDECDEVVYI